VPPEIGRGTDELFGLFSALVEEVDSLLGAAVVAPSKPHQYPDPARLSPIERRLLVRSVFAFIEALAYRLKQKAVLSANAHKLSSAESAMAKEEDYELDSDGTVRIRPARLRFLSNLRFAFSLWPRIEDAGFTLDVSGQGWRHLEEP